MISIFTPTNDVTFLEEAYTSIAAQTVADWEWVIVTNGGAEVQKSISFDRRVRIVPAPEGMVNIGALKRFACTNCLGDWLLELDHDDMLANDALESLPDADFAYSDSAIFLPDGTCKLFGEEWGWEHYTATVNGKEYKVNRSFDITPSSIAQIHYAPDHFRAWRRDAYWASGGHDADMLICDDHDLICRTYLSGAKMQRVDKCLYLYRLRADGKNAYLIHNQDIQTKQQDVSNKYIYRIITKWASDAGLPMYDLGGAFNRPEGYISIDVNEGADITHDVTLGLPFLDNSVGVIRAYDFLEHIPQSQVVSLMNEIYRVLVPGGWLLTATPSTEGRGAFQDPTHVSYWNPNSWWYYTRAQQAKYVPAIRCRFQKNRCWEEFPSDWHKTHHILYVYADLVAIKGQRQPGIVEI